VLENDSKEESKLQRKLPPWGITTGYRSGKKGERSSRRMKIKGAKILKGGLKEGGRSWGHNSRSRAMGREKGQSKGRLTN